jgi:NhaA family Na+:H+ antiporter
LNWSGRQFTEELASMNPTDYGSGTPLVADRISRTLDRFLHVEAISGVVLLIAATIALMWANSPWSASYEHFWHTPVSFGIGASMVSHSLHFWINDGLMTIFFLVVGLEIRREMHEGALATVRLALVPLLAAIGGVIVPAGIYLAFAPDAARSGWAVPTATDIAFAVGVLALLGKRIPAAVRVFLLAIAIIDDIAAILIIALFYSSGIQLGGLLLAALGVVVVFVWQWLGIRSAPAFIVPGVLVWCGLLNAGLHPTLAGVILGLLTPVRVQGDRDNALGRASGALEEFKARLLRRGNDAHSLVQPLKDLQRAQLQVLAPTIRVQAMLHPWVAYGVMPLFALANAGVSLPSAGLTAVLAHPIVVAVGLGLVVGKPLGIIAISALAARLRIGQLPQGLDWRGLLLVGCLGGVGFTMSIFIATLAFTSAELLAAAKLGILIASASAALLGLAAGRMLFQRPAV